MVFNDLCIKQTTALNYEYGFRRRMRNRNNLYGVTSDASIKVSEYSYNFFGIFLIFFLYLYMISDRLNVQTFNIIND